MSILLFARMTKEWWHKPSLVFTVKSWLAGGSFLFPKDDFFFFGRSLCVSLDSSHSILPAGYNRHKEHARRKTTAKYGAFGGHSHSETTYRLTRRHQWPRPTLCMAPWCQCAPWSTAPSTAEPCAVDGGALRRRRRSPAPSTDNYVPCVGIHSRRRYI